VERAWRILDGIAALARRDRRCSAFGADGHRYRLHPPLLPGEMPDLERLPADYRFWVTHIADGGAGPGYGLIPLRDHRDEGGWPPNENEIELAHQGCGTYDVLVLAEGVVYTDGDEGRRPQGSFCEWIEAWLASARVPTVPTLRAESCDLDISALNDLAVDAGFRGDLLASHAFYQRAAALVGAESDAGPIRALFRGWPHCLHTLARWEEGLAVVERGLRWAREQDREPLEGELEERKTEFLLRLGRFDEGLRRLLPAGKGAAHATVGWYCLERREWKQALAYLRKAGGSAHVHNLRGVAHKGLGDLEAAERAYRKSIAVDENAPALDNLGALLAHRGLQDAALAALREARGLDCRDVHVLATHGALLWLSGERELAIAELRRAIARGLDRRGAANAFEEVPSAPAELIELAFAAGWPTPGG
jgi:tetratricopeptide (TPR) repeat protein